MVTEATFTVASNSFPLGSIFRTVPDVTVELERVVPVNHVVIPYFWVRGYPDSDIASKFVAHPGVRNIECVDRVGDQHLLRCEWIAEYEGVLTGLLETSITLLTAEGTAEGWTFEIRGDRRHVAAFQQYCQDRGIRMTLSSVRALTPIDTPDRELTATQREALLLAYERGYYDSPRRSTLSEIADELEITRQALASRLRRGTRRLIASALVGRG